MTSGSLNGAITVALLAGVVLGIPVAALAREEPHGQTAGASPPAELARVRDGTPTR